MARQPDFGTLYSPGGENLREGPFGTYTDDVGPNDGTFVEVTRGTGEDGNSYDAETSFTVTLPGGRVISGDANSLVFGGHGEGEFTIDGENVTVAGSGEYSVLNGEASGEVVVTTADGQSWAMNGSVSFVDGQYLTLELDINSEEDGGELSFAFDTVEHTLALTDVEGEIHAIDLDDLLAILDDLATTYGEHLPDVFADAA